MQRLLRLLPILSLIALGAVLAACGGSDLASDPAKVLAEAKQPPAGPSASTLALEFVPKADAADSGSGDGGILGALSVGPISLEATAQGDADAMTADAKVKLGPVDAPISYRSTKDDAYVQLGGTWYALGMSPGLDIASIAGMAGDVSTLIRDPKATAVEDVDGIECDRISGKIEPGVDLAAQLGGLAENLPIDLNSLTTGDADLSVWVGREDHVIHRVKLDSSNGDVAKTGGLMIDVTTVPSEPVTVEAPADAKPLSDLLTGLGGDGLGALGGLLGGLDLGGLLGGAATGENA